MKKQQPKERRTCELKTCQKRFAPVKAYQRFCSAKCRWQSWFNDAVERAAQAARDNHIKGGLK